MATDCDESLHFHLLRIDCQLRVHFIVFDNSTLCKQSTACFGREVILLFLAFSGGSGIPVKSLKTIWMKQALEVIKHGPSFWGPPAIYNHKFETVVEKFEDLYLAVIFFQITFTTDISIYCPYFRKLFSIYWNRIINLSSANLDSKYAFMNILALLKSWNYSYVSIF